MQDTAFLGNAIPVSPPAGLNVVSTGWAYKYVGNAVAITNVAGRAMIGELCGGGNVAGVSFSDSNNNTWVNVTNHSGGAAAVAWNIAGGSNYVTAAYTNGNDLSIILLEFSGITAIDSAVASVGAATLSNTNVATSQCVFIGLWNNESVDTRTSQTLTPPGASPTEIHHGATHYDAQYGWLNSGSGYSAGTYVIEFVGDGAANRWITLGVK